MDPVSAIVTALTTAVVNLAEPAVKDAYNGLKALIKRRFSGDPVVVATVDNLEDEGKLERNSRTLESSLEPEVVANDAEILAALEALQTSIKEAETANRIRLTVEQKAKNEQNLVQVGATLEALKAVGDRDVSISQSTEGGTGNIQIGLAGNINPNRDPG